MFGGVIRRCDQAQSESNLLCATRRQSARRSGETALHLGRNSHVAGRYAIRLVEDAAVPASVRLEWSIKAE
jgi:hypothetical protein